MLTPENGERMADASVRFSAHPAAQPFNSIFEPFDNMLNYGLDSGRIEIMKEYIEILNLEALSSNFFHLCLFLLYNYSH